MNLKEQLMEDMKAAMRSGNKVDLEAIRFVIAKIKNVEIDQGEQDDTKIQQLISKQIKEMKEVMADYEKAGRPDLVNKDKENIKILERYLPAPLAEAEVDKIIDQVMADNPGAHMGMIIGKVNKETAGRADGAMVAQKVKAKLA